MCDRKIRDITAWINHIDDTQVEVDAGLDSVTDVRQEVERQKSVIVDLDTQRQAIAQNRIALSELDQNVSVFFKH